MEHPFRQWINLEQPRLGSRVVYATDDFFAPKERLIEAGEPVFVPDKYDDHGKWMDGWESRRRRGPGHDYCIIQLGVAGVIRGLDIDTSHFTGNFPPRASVDACFSGAEVPTEEEWMEILPAVDLGPDGHHFHAINQELVCSHVRLHIYPDGGVARLRIYGEGRPDWDRLPAGRTLDLVAMENGGRALACSDEHFGSMHNLNAPGSAANMGDGWETARRRGPGNDWVILRLGHAGIVEGAEIDTAHFKGNYPDRVSLEGFLAREALSMAQLEAAGWQVLLAETPLQMDQQHLFTTELKDIGPVDHVRLNMFPDGGISRLRVTGRLARQE